MDFDQVKSYWDERAASDNSVQSTTLDFYMREIEFRVVKNIIDRYRPASVMDVGCGDARTTARLAEVVGATKFIGGDYSEAMVKNARAIVAQAGLANLDVVQCDVSKRLPAQDLGMVYSTRCLINLPSWELQQVGLRNIAEALGAGGHYVMIENFIEGQKNLNRVRTDFGLPEIPVREHNLFFEKARLLDFVSDFFEIVEEANISSTYYLVSRVIYSKICMEAGVQPDYFDLHHKYGAQLPFSGDYGPVRMILMRKKQHG